MEVEEKTIGPVEFEGNPLLWTISKTGVPRMLVTGFLSFARYCGDQLPKRTTMGCLRILAALLVIVVPRSITYLLLYPIFRLVFGNLYPAYASYKAVRTKNVKEYVKWMMYWIVFALFTCAETFTDVFFSFWFPFYYEIKTILVVWLLSPATKGSSILYRRFVHPALIRREAEIDEALARATEQGYTAVLHLGSKGVNYATTVLMQTAIKHVLKPDNVLASQVADVQSASAISSSVKPPATSMDNRVRRTSMEISDYVDNDQSFQPRNTSSDDFVPVESVPSLHMDVHTDDENNEDDEIYPAVVKVPTKMSTSRKKTHRGTRSRKDKSTSTTSRRLRSRTRAAVYKFSDDDDVDQPRTPSS